MEEESTDASSTLSGSTVVNPGDLGYLSDLSDRSDDDDLNLGGPPLDHPQDDFWNGFYTEDEIMEQNLFGLGQESPPEVPPYPSDIDNDPAFTGTESHWLPAAIQRIPVYLSRFSSMYHPILDALTNPNDSPDDEDSGAHPLANPQNARLQLIGQLLASTVLSNFDLIIRMMWHRVAPPRDILVARMIVGMLVSSSAFFAARHSRPDGRGQGEVISMTQFWSGFLAAKAASLALNRYEQL